MKTQNITITSIMALFITAYTSVVFADEGAELYESKGCAACHGKEGKAPITGTYPKIGGQNSGYLNQQLLDFKSGARNNSQAALMQGLVQGIDDGDLEKISKYLSTID